MPDPTIETQATQQPSGAPPAGEVKPTTPAESTQQPNSKGWEAANQFKAELEATKAKLAAFETEKAGREKAEAEKKGEFEKLYKESEAKREAAEKKAAEA